MTVLKPPSTLYIVCGNDLQYLDMCLEDQVEVGTKVVRVVGQRERAGGCCGGRRSGRDTTPVQYSTVQYSTVQYSTVQYSGRDTTLGQRGMKRGLENSCSCSARVNYHNNYNNT